MIESAWHILLSIFFAQEIPSFNPFYQILLIVFLYFYRGEQQSASTSFRYNDSPIENRLNLWLSMGESIAAFMGKVPESPEPQLHHVYG